MKKYRGFARYAGALLAVLLSAAVLAPAALAAVPDRPENQYVLDSAGVLSASTEQEIIRRNTELFNSYGAQVVIAAVDFLGGEAIDDYANKLFNAWGVGSQERNNGILLVMAIGEEDYYATSGDGIASYFDGAMFRELLDDYLEDDFAAGNYDAGVLKFFDATANKLEDYYGRAPAAQEGTQASPYTDGYTSSPRGWGALLAVATVLIRVVVIVAVILFVLRLLGRGGGGRGGYGGGGGGFWQGMFLGSMLNNRRHRSHWGPPPPPPGPRPGGFGGPRPPSGGFGGRPGSFGGFSGGGSSHGGGAGRGGFGGRGSGGFHSGGSSRGGGAGRR